MDEVMKSLATLERVEPGQKLSFYMGKITIVDNPSIIGRWISGNNKHVTLLEVSKIIDSAISLNAPIDPKILNCFENLKITYHRSKSMVISLSELQKHVAAYIHEQTNTYYNTNE